MSAVHDILDKFALAWPYLKADTDGIELWENALAGIDGQELYKAAEWVILNDDRPPSIARVRQVVREARPPAPFPALPSGSSSETKGAPDFFKQAMAEQFAGKPRGANPVHFEPSPEMQAVVAQIKAEREEKLAEMRAGREERARLKAEQEQAESAEQEVVVNAEA